MGNFLRNLYRELHYKIIKRNYYYFSASSRSLPDFIINGTVRSGTTSLFNYLGQHPSIINAYQDEIGFFDSNFHLGFNWYRSFFPTFNELNKIKNTSGYSLTCEDTPFYFWKPNAIKLIKKHLPNCTFITIFRNPIDRAYSNYHLAVRTGNEKNSFEDVIQNEIKILKNSDLFSNSELILKGKSYVGKSLYSFQFKNWLDEFDLSKIHTLSTEELSKDPEKSLNDIFDFLKIPRFKVKNLQKHKHETYAPMNAKTRELLSTFFQPYNEELFKMIGKRFDWET